jgi:hypothetical protein
MRVRFSFIAFRGGVILAVLAAAVSAGALRAEPVIPPVRPAPRIAFTLDDLKAQMPQSKEGNLRLEVPEIWNSAGDPEVQNVLTGKMVETMGQIALETARNAEGKRIRIARTMIVCCAAHPRVYSLAIEFAGRAPELKESAWVRVIGTVSYKEEEGKAVAILLVKGISEVAKPEVLMLK